jgi:hypothetical protein
VVDEHDVRRIAVSFPDVTEDGGDFSFRVDATLFAWPYPERVHPKRARVPRKDIFVIRVADLDDKQALLEGEPDVFFTTAHYEGSAMLMVRLAEIDEARLTELLRDAHAALATKSRKRAERA